MKKRSVLPILFFIVYTTLHCQSIIVRQLPIIDQLPSNSVHRIFQDKEGYMWLGTAEGICRYDGNFVKIFRNDFKSPDLLTSNDITCIAEDFNNNILIGTSEGLTILNKHNYTFSPFPGNNLRYRNIRDILVAADSTIWIGSENFILRYNKDFSLKDYYYHTDKDSASIPNGGINSLFEDSYHNIWLTMWTKGLHKYNVETNKFVAYPPLGKTNNPFKIFQDKQNNYWVATWNDGIYFFNPNFARSSCYRKIETKDKNLDKTFFSIAQDNTLNYIWLMSLSGIQAFKYNSNSDPEIVDLHNTFDNTNNIFSEIIKDNKGSLWIAAFSEGVFKIEFKDPSLSNFPINIIDKNMHISPSFTTLIEDDDDDIWVNQNRFGLCIYSPKNKQFKSWSEIPEIQDYTDLQNVNYINICGSKREIWLSNNKNSKIIKIQKQNFKTRIVGVDDLSNITTYSGSAQSFFTDKQGNIWIGTTYSLFLKKATSDSIILIQKNIGSVNEITEDMNSNIWISTSKSGLFQIKYPYNKDNPSITKIGNEWIGNHIQTIAMDHSGKIWIGTKEGKLYSYENNTKIFTEKTINCGLTGESILDIIIDKYNHLWISTYKNVIEYNPGNNAHFTYNNSDDLQVNSFLKGSKFISADSKRVYFGGNKGYSCFFPSEKLKLPPEETNVIITDIKIQNKSIFDQDCSSKYIKKDNTLILSPDDKNIEIDFSSLNFDNPQKIKYSYKLSNIDDSWVKTKKGRQFALYSQLNKGKYTFSVKSSDTHSLWNKNITELKIIKLPSFYETNAAYIGYILIIGFFIFFLMKIILGKNKIKNQLKMNLFERNKTEELTQTKLKYFTNISHELLTPLTIISCIIDDIETTSSKNQPQFSTMRSNVVRLKRLLQQILDFKRIEDGKMKLQIMQSDIKSFINDLCQNHFITIFNKKNISFNLYCQHQRIVAFFDADKIDKVLFNILSNAFKFTHEGGNISLTLSPKIINKSKFLDIIISDNGIGIKEEDLDHIFSRFYTNRSLNASETHGIGLSLCKDLIELHHGKIAVKSALNKGTTFIITIPIDKQSYSTNEIAANNILDTENENNSEDNILTNEKENEKDSPLKEINILVVEDNEELLSLMNHLLSKNYNVLTATNGKEAMLLIRKTDIDIIISDVMMPEMDGITLCKEVKNNIETSHISVIMLTAKNSINDKLECYNAGADAFISKPFEMKILDARIRNFISQKKNRQQEFKSDVSINISALENKSMDEQFLKNAVLIIENNLTEASFDINSFADELNISKSSLYRKIKTITGLSPIEFIKNIKLKHACLMLKNNHTVADVAYAVGYSDPKYFSVCFKAEFNITPKEYQKAELEKEEQKEILINGDMEGRLE